jgi:phage tail P2-like protein
MPSLPINLTETAIQFSNSATRPGELNGVLTLVRDRQRRDLKSYELHWGSGPQQTAGASSRIQEYSPENIGSAAAPHYVFNQPSTCSFDHTAIPRMATHLLVFVIDTANRKRLYASRSLIDRRHLLPPSATQLERQLAATSSRLGRLPVLLDTLWDPSRCPSNLLPWFGWALSNDIWYDNPDDLVQESLRRRQLIRSSSFVHQHKGTRAAIQQALDAFANASVTLTEWWEQTPRGYPHTFVIDLLVNASTDGAGTADLNNQLRRAIDAVKPVRSHYTFTISTVQTSSVRLAASIQPLSYKRFTMAATL